MHQKITLDVRYDQPQQMWAAVLDAYGAMPGWIESDDFPHWFGSEGDAKYVTASVEPSGIVFEGEMESREWEQWVAQLCAQLSTALGRPVRDAED
ncbi:hypothetical protein [Comamonas sp. B-9]|uniref:hypothetical protein n=1 Tax=Comamonas sp. B-9 TaxID=1055192 RepID=UPI0003957501|nr:hypothetical protein [Comamonas sp. B-9]